MELTLGHGLTLPPRKPRIIAMEVTAHQELSGLAASLDQILATAGIANPEIRQFRSHITVARAKTNVSEHDQAKVASWSDADVHFQAQTIALYESKLTPTGPIYTALGQATLS